MKRLTALLIALMTLTPVALAQDYLYELGVVGGMSVAYGDVNKSRLVYDPGFVGGVQFRYNHNLRWAFAAELGSYGLKGDTRDFDNHYPAQAGYQFDRRLWQLSLRPEFAFRNYGWGNDFREKQRLVPYVTVGIGLGLATGDSYLLPSGADAVGDPIPADDGSQFVFAIPLGVGLKWKVAPRWNVQAACLFTKTFNDRTDGVKDPMGIASGAMKNTDWVGSLTVGISYSFGERCVTCNTDRQ
jgi:opacity protein-like surface antigen